MTRDVDVAVVGGGAAGLTAAHFLARAGLSVEVYDQDRSILKRARLFNLPGQEELEGRELLTALRAKVDAAGAAVVPTKVNDIAPGGGTFTVTLDGGDTVTARYVVLATGQGTLRLGSLPLETTDARQPFVKVNVVTDRWGATSVPGVWAAGVVAGWPSQAVACAGSGAAVAIEIASAAKGEFWVDHDDTTLATDPE
ncbi:MAG: FAD-dependent oxidoreductase [Acidimicrobiales bacterium]